ncbi:uncharacterized protein STEHIDRAFT_60774, partial [Stereum hirsutum FP-91666 SS1]|uniref:uncharacterized protein n=1 Tax=Stereum hirsutum (strain FP-91666) TaxID=721885 RepID=UPI0004449646
MSFDFGDSDLSDLTSSSEDEYVPLAQLTKRKTKTKKLQDKSGYTITGALRPPRTAQYTARSLHEQIVEGTINLDPDYQRDVVWKEEKQIGLVDSIFRNYYIPPVIFAVKNSDDGTEERVCIDGKQRLTSIQRCVSHRPSLLSGARYWYKSIGSGKRTLLPASTASQFANKQIVCMEYHDLTGDQEREIFQRVQLGVALTPAERMAAITGPWPTFIREIETQILGEEDGFGDALDWGQSRGRDFQGIAAVVFVIDRHPAFAVPVSPGLDKWLTQTLAVPKKLRSDVLDTFQLYLLLTKDSRYNAPFQTPQRISPVEFIMIGLLIYVHRQTLSLTQLSLAVEAMRADIRGKEKDIRTNKRVAQVMFKFINEEIP